MYSTYSGGMLVVSSCWGVYKIFYKNYNLLKKMTATGIKSDLSYLNKSVHEYNNSYDRTIGKKYIHAECFALN